MRGRAAVNGFQTGKHIGRISSQPQIDHQKRKRSIRRCVRYWRTPWNSLPEEHRTVFVLRDIEGMSTAETAESLGISEENVKVRLFRARAAIRRRLFERAGTA